MVTVFIVVFLLETDSTFIDFVLRIGPVVYGGELGRVERYDIVSLVALM